MADANNKDANNDDANDDDANNADVNDDDDDDANDDEDDDANDGNDDKYIMIQCLFVTFLFIPALLPSPLPRQELLCLDKT